MDGGAGRSTLATARAAGLKRWENQLYFELELLGLRPETREHRFHPVRRWRFDLAYPSKMVAVEFEGGLFSGGAHVRGKHYESDLEKYNEACLLGWRVIRVSERHVRLGTAYEWVRRALEGKS